MVCFTYDIILINEYLFELIPYDKYKTTFIKWVKNDWNKNLYV